MSTRARGPRALPAGITEALTPVEQAHMDSGGADALPTDSGAATTAIAGADTLAAGGGADSVAGTGGADSVAAGAGADTVAGAAGADSVAGAAEGDGKTKMVPHAALHEEREARKAAEKRAGLLEERTNLILRAIQEGKLGAGQAAAAAAAPVVEDKGPELVAVPKFEDDPAGHYNARIENQERMRQHELAKVNEVVGAIAKLLVGQHETGQQTGKAQAAWQRAQVLENQFRAANPDHDDAMAHLKAARTAQLQAFGVTDPAQIEHQLNIELQQIAEHAAANNLNPAEILYASAKAVGYTRKEAAAIAAAGAPGAAAGAGATPGARIAAAAAGQAAAGPGAVRGNGPKAPLDANKLIAMSDADFAKAISTPEGRALLGA